MVKGATIKYNYIILYILSCIIYVLLEIIHRNTRYNMYSK